MLNKVRYYLTKDQTFAAGLSLKFILGVVYNIFVKLRRYSSLLNNDKLLISTNYRVIFAIPFFIKFLPIFTE